MKIPGGNEITDYVDRSVGESQKPDANTTVKDKEHVQDGKRNIKEGAIVDLSQRSKDMQTAEKAMRSAPDLRMEKVKAIRERIEKGAYDIDYDGTAEKILDAFFEDMK
jgi:flagellar biosynthesis anti-sigma factor FlgM